MCLRGICVDVGCGSETRYSFNPQCPLTYENVLVDIDFPSEKVRKFLTQFTTVHFIVASVDHLPLRSGIAKLVYAMHVIEHVEYLDLSISELVRIVDSEGRLIIATPNFLSINATRDPDHKQILNFIKLYKKLKKTGCRKVSPRFRAGSKIPKPFRTIMSLLFNVLCEELMVICIK